MLSFIGREKELNRLNQLTQNMTTNLVVVRGRRRIGKSRLIAEFAKPYSFYRFEGLMPRFGLAAQDQRDEFARVLGRYFGLPGLKADNWADLFEVLAKHTKKGRVVILLDEVSWMAHDDPDFLGKLKIAWDQFFKNNSKLILFLCSSISPWIEKNLVGSTGYLGRPTLDMTLQELPLPRCNEFLVKNKLKLSPYEKLKILSVTGGVPRYLELLNKTMTANQNIKQLFFNKESPLFNEFDYIFSDIYSKRNSIYKKIIKALLPKHKTQHEISDSTGIGQTGDLSEYLHDLELGGFVERDYTWDTATGKVSKLSTYRLKDNYARFYLKYIEPNTKKIEKDLMTERSMNSLPGWESITGLQFENLVVGNHKKLIELLNIEPDSIVFANPYFQRKKSRSEACQIDYLIQTRDCVYLVEIKFSKNKIGPSIIREVEEKERKLKLPKYMSCHAVLIHVNGVTGDVMDSDVFSKIIDFGEML